MNCAINRSRMLLRNAYLGNVARPCSSSSKGNEPKGCSTPELPPEPTTCCMSGCQNCVWIQYAAELTKILNDGGEKARELVLEKISDPSLKMFLRMELQNIETKNDPDDPT
ncbi:oxidoreductase-like domain-containing protein 1 [Anopheles coustani]|uniref:oxidoreductase-like domain-containing protein 1 n=1 Tax=Anopheles coustani TaxID=139045 RepID=UPI0026584470|nr:oxidoreductase-like domain-containing protein 1 [Anopheles coustani]